MRRNNRKPHRRLPTGLPPWVRVWQAAGALASQGASLVEDATRQVDREPAAGLRLAGSDRLAPTSSALPPATTPGSAAPIYQAWLHRLRIPQRFPHPDWSVADLWIAKELLRQGTPGEAVTGILRDASPQFPRRHADPEDYLRRTLARAMTELACAPFPRSAAGPPEWPGFPAAPGLL